MTDAKNIFLEQPEFVNSDPRFNRPRFAGYDTNPEFMLARHELFLPRPLIENKNVLDLGSCNAASGAWCLSEGAASYTGVEMQESFVKSSTQLLTKYYAHRKWEIIQSSIEDYLASPKEVFDLVLASGVLYAFSDAVGILKAIARIANTLVVESRHPRTFVKTPYLSDAVKRNWLPSKSYVDFIENEPFISLGREAMVLPDQQTIYFKGTTPSMGAVKYIMEITGFRYYDGLNRALKKRLPQWYSPAERFGLFFARIDGRGAEELGFLPATSGRSRHMGILKWEDEA